MPTDPGQESRRRKAVTQEGTARRQARAALEASERFLRESQRVGRIGSYDFDILAGRWRSSAVMDEIFGIGPAYGRTVAGWLDLIHPDDRDAMKAYLLDEVVGRRTPFDREYRIRTHDTGLIKWVHGLGQLEEGPDGLPIRMLGTIQDITERRRTAAILEESERNYREIFNASGDALFVHDEQGRVVDVNECMCAMYRCDRTWALGQHPDQASLGEPPYSAAEALAHVQRAVTEGPQVFQWRARRRDGELFWAEVALRACCIAGRQRVIAAVRDITGRKETEERLRDQQEMVAAIVETSQDWIWAIDTTGRHTYSNQAVERILGWTASDFHGMGLDLMHPDDRRQVEAEWPGWLASRQGWRNHVARWRHRDGSYRYLESSSVPILDDDGNLRGFRGVDRDVTERRQAEDALAASEARFRQLFDQAMDAIFLADTATGLLIDANRAAERLTGRPRAGIIGMHQRQLHPAGEEAHYAALFSQAAHASGESRAQGELVTVDGRRVPVEINAGAITLPDGRHVVQGIFRDISERQRAEDDLRRSERRLALAISATADAIWDWDLVTGQTYYSPRWYAMLGYRDQEFPMTFASWCELCHPDDRSGTIAKIDATRTNPGSAGYVAEFRMRHRDGSWRWIQGRGNVVGTDAAGRAVRMSGTNSDITEQKRVEVERQRLFDLSQDLLCVAGYDGYLKQVNPAWTRVLGWSEQELTSQPWLFFVHPDDQEATAKAGEALSMGRGVIGFENRYRCKDGGYRLLSWNSSPLMDDRLIFAVVRDLTDLRHNEERLRQMEKMDAIGQLAGGVAHDFNNQLGAIMGFAEMLEKRLSDPAMRRYAQNILTATRRSADLTGQLLAFARKGQYLRVPVDIHAVIAETVAILARSIDRRIHFQQLLKAHPAQVAGDPTQIQNALLNLGLNARDAMPDGGTLTFATEVVHLSGQESQRLGLGGQAGVFVELQVVDNGIGMSDEVQAHLFEPFFTTKAPGKGTGMGLAAVYGTIRNHGGAISAMSAVGTGTTFRILLPLLAAADATPTDAAATPPPEVRHHGILIIDDEAMLRDLLGELLEDDGHTVFRAANGQEGVATFRAHQEAIDLVILDLVMPEMNGHDCFRALKAIAPEVRVLLVSGYSLNGEAQTILAEGAQGFIQKPFQKDELLRKMDEMLPR